MSTFTLKGIPSGIGWHNALGIAMARVRAAERAHASSLMPDSQQLRTAVLQRNRLRLALTNLPPNPSRIDAWFSVVREASPEEDQYRTALHMLDLYQLAHSNELAFAAADILDDIVYGIMFHEVAHETPLTVDDGIEAGNRYDAISTYLGEGNDRVFQEAEELRSDSDLLLSDSEANVAFARIAYASLIPLMAGSDSIGYEIRSIMSVATHQRATPATRKATVHILRMFELYHPRLISAVAASYAQELRDEISTNTHRWRQDELDLAVEEYGFVSMWMEAGCRELVGEIDAWHTLIHENARPPVAPALKAISYLIYNLADDGSGAIVHNVAHELVDLLRGHPLDTILDSATRLMSHLIETSESEPSFMMYMASELRRVAQEKQSPALLLDIYATFLSYANDELLAAERPHIERFIRKDSAHGAYAWALQETIKRIDRNLGIAHDDDDDDANVPTDG